MEDTETRIREALESEAARIEVPPNLATATLAAATEESAGGNRRRSLAARARRDARAAGGSGSGRGTRMLAGAAAAAVLVLVFAAVGSMSVQMPDGGLFGGSQDGVLSELSRGTTAEFAPDSPPADRAQPVGQAGTGQRIVRTAEVEVRVERGRFDAAWSEANAIAGRHGGFVTTSEAATFQERLARGSLTMRVPADRLDAAVSDLRGLGTLVRQTTSAADVSGQIVDMEARLRSLRTQETRYLELVGQAQNVGEVLEVQRRLDDVRAQIESTQAERDNLQGQVELSTLTAALYEPDAQPSPRAGGPIAEALRRALDAAVVVTSGMIVVAAALAPILVLGLVVWAVVRFVRARLT